MLENSLNLLRLYNSLETVFTEFYNTDKVTSIFPSNTLTSFYFDISDLEYTSTADIDIYLTDCNGNETDFKTVADTNDIIISNDRLIYKNNTQLTSSFNDMYYLRITDGVINRYSNKFMMGVVDIDYVVDSIKITYERLAAIDPLEIKITCSSTQDITVVWGDGTEDTLSVGTSEVTFSNTYASDSTYPVEIKNNLEYIVSLKINNAGVTAIDTFEYLSNLIELDLSDSQIQNIPFKTIYSLVDVDLSDTNTNTIAGIEQSPIQILTLNNVTSLQTDLTNADIVSKLINLLDIYLDGCNLTSISSGVVFSGYNDIKDLEDINAQNNLFSTLIELSNDTRKENMENIKVYDMSYNNLIGNPWNTQLFENGNLGTYCLDYNFSYNNLSTAFIDRFLKHVADNHTDLANVAIDFTGYSKLNGNDNESPTNGIYESTLPIGTGFIVGETISPTDGGGTGCIITVTEVTAGVPTAYEITNAGSDYVSIPTTFTTSASGVLALLTLKTPKLIITSAGGTVNNN